MSESPFAGCKARSDAAIADLRERVQMELGSDAALLETTTIYVTGSAARGEMSEHSDIDLFVVRLNGEYSDLDNAALTGAIDRALRAIGKPRPSKDGRFVKMQLASKLVGELGTDNDDFYNHFTARMLLLLESKPLLGPSGYQRLVDQVLERYWKDSEKHGGDYVPFLLVNDIVRYWRILLLNYAAKIAGQDADVAERRMLSYKLRFSRCLMCFSALTHLMAEYRTSRNVTLAIGRRAVDSTPLQRLDLVAELEPSAGGRVASIKDLYSAFLTTTATDKAALIEKFKDNDYKKARADESRKFGDAIFDLVQALGEGPGREMLRIMVV